LGFWDGQQSVGFAETFSVDGKQYVTIASGSNIFTFGLFES